MAERGGVSLQVCCSAEGRPDGGAAEWPAGGAAAVGICGGLAAPLQARPRYRSTLRAFPRDGGSLHQMFPSAAVWDFHVLLVREGLTSDLPELHSTPWSSVRLLDPADRRAQEFFQPPTSRTGNDGSSSLELDLDTLLSQKYSGETRTVSTSISVSIYRVVR